MAQVVVLSEFEQIMALVASITASAEVIANTPVNMAISKDQAQQIIAALTPLDEKFKAMAGPSA